MRFAKRAASFFGLRIRYCASALRRLASICLIDVMAEAEVAELASFRQPVLQRGFDRTRLKSVFAIRDRSIGLEVGSPALLQPPRI